MDKQRRVHKMLSVFDILNYRSILLPYKSSLRVLFDYDAEEKKRNFTILSKDIPEDTCKLLVEMLKENITSERIIYRLDSNNLDYADIISKEVWMRNVDRDQGLINNLELSGYGSVQEKQLMIN